MSSLTVPRATWVLLIGCVCAPATVVSAQALTVRDFAEQGLPSATVWGIAQDAVGFLWVASEGGLYRFDGQEMRRWAPDMLRSWVADVAVAPDGGIYAAEGRGAVYRVTRLGVEEIELPWPRIDPDRFPAGVLAFDEAGRLTLRYGPAVHTLHPEGWRSLGPDAFEGERPDRIFPATGQGVLVSTREALWGLRDGRPRRLYAADVATGEVVVGATEPSPGRVLVLVNVAAFSAPRILEVHEGRVRELAAWPELPRARAITLLERRGTVWMAQDRYLVAVRDGEPPMVTDADDGFESGGPMLVDREGSLWLGSFVGLHQYAEPDTRTWSERHGIASRHTRFLAIADERVWLQTWGGSTSLAKVDGRWTTRPQPWMSRSEVCVDGAGRVWADDVTSVVELRGTDATRWPELPGPMEGCAPDPDGGVWLGTATGVAYVSADGTRRPVPPLPPATEPYAAWLQDRSGRVWVGSERLLCQGDAARLKSGEGPGWQCEEMGWEVVGMAELADGTIWAAGFTDGLWRHDGGWHRIAIDGAPTGTVHSVFTSPRGGAWVIGEGVLIRAVPSAEGGIDVLERLTAGHGLASPSGRDIVEQPNGDLWLATSRGLTLLPASARFEQPEPPGVALVDATVDGAQLGIDSVPSLPHESNRIGLRFAALSYRDRSSLRHQVRLGVGEPWTDTGGEPSVQWVDLSPGSYRAEYRASRDGVEWSEEPAVFSFTVLPPWYRTWWFLGLTASAALALATLVYRARVTYLLRLEKQRTTIALDLHDQIGSGLASVGVLSGVMATEDGDDPERRSTAAEIALVAEELSHSLSDIVWSLDPRTASIEELASRLTEHGERLFADGRTSFTTRLASSVPDLRSTLDVRRAVFLIGLEALHNAAKHAAAQEVLLTLDEVEGGHWVLEVRDDGRGIDLERAGRGAGGRGLPGMERRAGEIGAELDVSVDPRGGTVVRLHFDPRGRSRGGRWARAFGRLSDRIFMRVPAGR